MTDTAALIVARSALRKAYYVIRAIRTDEPAIRCVLNDLDQMACGLSSEIAEAEPELALR